jgi:hypothetical protein
MLAGRYAARRLANAIRPISPAHGRPADINVERLPEHPGRAMRAFPHTVCDSARYAAHGFASGGARLNPFPAAEAPMRGVRRNRSPGTASASRVQWTATSHLKNTELAAGPPL